MKRTREALAGDLEDLVDELLPAGEGGSDAIQRVTGRLANEGVGVFQGVYQAAWGLRRGVGVQVVGIPRGDERSDNRRADRRAQRPDELRGRGRDAEKPFLDRALD